MHPTLAINSSAGGHRSFIVRESEPGCSQHWGNNVATLVPDRRTAIDALFVDQECPLPRVASSRYGLALFCLALAYAILKILLTSLGRQADASP